MRNVGIFAIARRVCGGIAEALEVGLTRQSEERTSEDSCQRGWARITRGGPEYIPRGCFPTAPAAHGFKLQSTEERGSANSMGGVEAIQEKMEEIGKQFEEADKAAAIQADDQKMEAHA